MNSKHVERMIRPLLAELQTLHLPLAGEHTPSHRPFITISRQAGAGGTTLARKLVARLNADEGNARPWKLWDRELVEAVASQYHLSQALVDALEDQSRSWLEEFFDGLKFRGSATELRLYHRTAATIRAIASAGCGVIVGRGGSFITRELRGGVHVRLVAPRDWRIKHAAEVFGYSQKSAAMWVNKTDRARDTFHRRYGPATSLAPEAFDITLNASRTDFDHLTECILPLMQRSDAQTAVIGSARTPRRPTQQYAKT